MIQNGFIFIKDKDGVIRFSIRVDDVLCVFHQENQYNPDAKGCRIQYYNRFERRVEEVEFKEVTVDDFCKAMIAESRESFTYQSYPYFIGNAPSFYTMPLRV